VAYLIGAFLGSTIHVIHCPRRSSWESEVADDLTRKRTTSFLEQQIINRYIHLNLPKALTDWMSNPSNNWELASDLLNHVVTIQK
jgi:hypothetical protein